MKIWEKERQKAAVRGERGLMTKQLNVVDHKSNYLKLLFHPRVGERRKRQFLQVGGSHYNGGGTPATRCLGNPPNGLATECAPRERAEARNSFHE